MELAESADNRGKFLVVRALRRGYEMEQSERGPLGVRNGIWTNPASAAPEYVPTPTFSFVPGVGRKRFDSWLTTKR